MRFQEKHESYPVHISSSLGVQIYIFLNITKLPLNMLGCGTLITVFMFVPAGDSQLEEVLHIKCRISDISIDCQ